MKSLRNLVITLATITLCSQSLALSFSYADGSSTWLSASDSNSNNNSVSGWLDITTGNSPNYNPATMSLTSATVKFAFADTLEPNQLLNLFDEFDSGPGNDAQYREYISVTLDTLSFKTGAEVDGTHLGYDWSNVSGSLAGGLFGALQTDGKLHYVVTVTAGDTWFKGAKLTAVGGLQKNP